MKFPPGGGRIPIGWSEGKLSYGDEAPGAARAATMRRGGRLFPAGKRYREIRPMVDLQQGWAARARNRR